MKDVLRIPFRKSKEPQIEFELIDLQEFVQRRIRPHSFEHHSPGFFIVFVFQKGSGEHEVDFVRYRFRAGDVLLVGANQVHRFVRMDRASGLMMVFTERFVSSDVSGDLVGYLRIFRQVRLQPCISLPRDQHENLLSVARLAAKESHHAADVQKAAILKASLKWLLAILERRSSTLSLSSSGISAARFHEFSSLLESHFLTDRNVANYARRMHISAKTLSDAVTEVAGMSPKQFINDRVILEIKRYLAQNTKSLVEISSILGFDEPTNLTKYFKKYTGKTPTEFRSESCR